MQANIPPTIGDLSWRTAQRCNAGNCVRVARSGDLIMIGDTKAPDGPILASSQGMWESLVETIKRGEFG